MPEAMVYAYEYIDEAEEWWSAPVAVWPSSVLMVEPPTSITDGPLAGAQACVVRMAPGVASDTTLYMPGTIAEVAAMLSRSKAGE